MFSMNRLDFTLHTAERLYGAYLDAGYQPLPFADYLKNLPASNTVILRHDVDRKPSNSLDMAKLQHRMGIRGTYYFRIVPASYDVAVLKKIAALGHEIGYHYEDMTICKGDVKKAYEHFKRSLEDLRKYYPVTTVCMHGSPLSKWDARELWKHYNYRLLGVTGEPYFELDLAKGIYLTDTGRMWDGDAFSVRDRIAGGHSQRFRTTFDIVKALEEGTMPALVMQNFHPQRWTNHLAEWSQELVMQSIKNRVKKVLRKIRN